MMLSKRERRSFILGLFTLRFSFLFNFSDWLFKWSWLGLYIILIWISQNNRRVDWEVGCNFILVSITYIDIHVFSLVIEVERSRPLEGSHDYDTVADSLASLSFVLCAITHFFDDPRAYLHIL